MPFCSNCGSQLPEGSAFCSNCGARQGAGGSVTPTSVPVVSSEPLDYDIEGDNLQIIRVRLKPGQELIAEAGKMVYKTPSVEWQTKMTGEGIGQKLFGALKRKLTGESLFLTHFRLSGAKGEVGFAGDFPGRIQAFELGAGQAVLVQRDGFVAAEASVTLDIAFTKKIGAGLFGGEGFILQKLTGPGTAFIHGGGDFVEFTLGSGESLQIDTGCVVAFDESVSYDVQFAGGIASSIFGGEGLFLATLTGPGRAIIQTMTLSKLRRELGGGVGAKTGGGEAHGLETLTNFFGSSD
ncbi:MAG: TIGR00266 family protein [Acidobacteria bacterium]|nr:TIGR00266 family protein [Acidobacteriota bacterium]